MPDVTRNGVDLVPRDGRPAHEPPRPPGLLPTEIEEGPVCDRAFFSVVDVVLAYSNLLHPHKPRAQLEKLMATAAAGAREPASDPSEPRAVVRRLGAAKIDELVAAYEAGTPTTELMKSYSLSKSAV
jgi:hypothetical protein